MIVSINSIILQQTNAIFNVLTPNVYYFHLLRYRPLSIRLLKMKVITKRKLLSIFIHLKSFVIKTNLHIANMTAKRFSFNVLLLQMNFLFSKDFRCFVVFLLFRCMSKVFCFIIFAQYFFDITGVILKVNQW